MKITFYHWGVQCPIIYEMLRLFQNDTIDNVSCIDISKNTSLVDQSMFYSFLTVIDEEIYWYSPITSSVLEKIRNRTLTKDIPYQIIQSQTVIKGDIV